MAHPYHHSLSSARNSKDKKTKWQDHFEVHDWLDSSKFAFADARHRSLFHNPAGVSITAKIFKDIKGIQEITTQHIKEDMGRVYKIKQWLPSEHWPTHTLNKQPFKINPSINLTNLKASLMENNPFPSTIQTDISLGIDLLLTPETSESLEVEDMRRFFLFSSAGPYIIERLLGPTVNPDKNPNSKDDKLLATRSVFEFFIQKTWGFIPSHQDIMSQRPIEDWMWKKAVPLSRQL